MHCSQEDMVAFVCILFLSTLLSVQFLCQPVSVCASLSKVKSSLRASGLINYYITIYSHKMMSVCVC